MMNVIFTSWATENNYELTLPLKDELKHLLFEEGEVDGSNFWPLNGLSLARANDLVTLLANREGEFDSSLTSDMDLFHQIYQEEGDGFVEFEGVLDELIVLKNDNDAIFDYLVETGYIEDFTQGPFGCYFDYDRFVEEVKMQSTYWESGEHIAFKMIVLPY